MTANVFHQLDRDWAVLARSSTAAAALRHVLDIAQVSTLAELDQWTRTAPRPTCDQVLLALVTDAVGGSALAARVALQLLQPGIRRLVGSVVRVGPGQDVDERAAAVLAAVYARIRTYPVSRRPGKVAANILLDARQAVAHRARHNWRTIPQDWRRDTEGEPRVDDLPSGLRRPGVGELPAALRQPAIGEETRHLDEELWDVLLDAINAGVISVDDAELIATTRIGRRHLSLVAEERGASLRTLQRRRRHAESVLAATGVAA